MSYSSINDAYNIQSGYNLNLSQMDYNSLYKSEEPVGILPEENMSWGSLDGTNLLDDNNEHKSKRTLKSNPKQQLNTNKITKNLTHRECINIYNNQEKYKKTIIDQAIKHINGCKMCKDTMKDTKKKSLDSQILSQLDSSDNSKSSHIEKILNNLASNSTIQTENTVNNTQTKNLDLSNIKIENELKTLADKINGESNLKYQNALIQNNISKYLEDLEEKKNINKKLDKIIELIEIDSTVKNTKNKDSKNFYDSVGMFSSPELYHNLSKLNELVKPNHLTQQDQQTQQTQHNNSIIQSGYDLFLYLGVIIIIILLIVDIILRLNITK
jgi:hypothetical protein